MQPRGSRASSRDSDGGVEPGPGDIWALESHGYSPDKFYTKSTDGRGNSELVNVKFSPFANGMMSQLVQSDKFPSYTTRQDIIRDAFNHRMVHVATLECEPLKEHQIAMLIEESTVDHLMIQMEQDERLMNKVLATMAKGIESGNLVALGDAIEAAERCLDKLPFNYGAKVQREIELANREYQRMRDRSLADSVYVETLGL